MKWYQIVSHGRRAVIGLSLIAGIFLLTACSGDDGAPGAAGPAGPPGLTTTTTATSLDISINSVTINSAPVVEFSVKNEDGVPFVGVNSGDFSFTIAKLEPATNGNPSYWQNYINTEETATVGPGTGNTTVQASRESNGTLVNNGDGTYAYTFAIDIANVTSPLAVPYEPTLTHRVAIQVGGGLPVSNPIYTFRPSDGATTGILTRDIVKIENCNECHNKLAMHGGGRIDTKYCVTCHNPGTTDANSGNTVDFKVMIHKIHRGEDLPSVAAGGDYAIWGYRDSKNDFSDVVFPQDIRNCTKCHDGSDPDTPDGDNWETQLSMQACGSCHDDIDFSKDGSPAGANDPAGHPGGIVTSNSACVTCHADNRIAGSVAEAHYLYEPAARAKFKLNILKICGTDVGSNPICAPGVYPTVTFSVTDPTNGDAKYDITTTPEISGSNLSMLVAWNTDDYTNIDGTGQRPARADSISISGAVPATDPLTYTVTADFIIPDGTGTNGYVATGSGAIGFQGRLVADYNGNGTYNETLPNGDRERIYPKSEVAYFSIDDATVVPRRQVVDNDKCNQCHEQVSLHGGSRNGEALVCVLCHNPNNTDVNDRPKDPAGGIDVAATVDGKREVSIDLKRFIHGIHAGAQTNYDGTAAHGFREFGLTIGDGGHDYSDLRFPGILNDCETCHLSGTYVLDGDWESPTQNGILSSTTDAAPTATDTASVDAQIADPADDLNISPTAAVCSSCHDSDVEKAHMEVPGGAVFDQTQDVITNTPVIETCAVCHGPGRDADVQVVHAAGS